MNLGKCVVSGRQNDMLSLSEIWEMKKHYKKRLSIIEEKSWTGIDEQQYENST